MAEKNKQVKFKIGDRVVELKSGDKGTIVRFGADEHIVQVRWDGGSQQMMEVTELEKEGKGET